MALINGFIVQTLVENGLLVGQIGEINPSCARCAITVQARSAPKQVFLTFSDIAQAVSSGPLRIYVDDLYSQAFLGRTSGEQMAVNDQYQRFGEAYKCEIVFTRSLFDEPSRSTNHELLKLAEALTFKEFLRCLPRERREQYEDLPASECFHALIQLHLFEYMIEVRDCLLIGQSSQAIVVAHRNLSLNRLPLSALILPRFASEEEILRYRVQVVTMLGF